MKKILSKTVKKTQWTRTGYMMTIKTVLIEEKYNYKTITIKYSNKKVFFNSEGLKGRY